MYNIMYYARSMPLTELVVICLMQMASFVQSSAVNTFPVRSLMLNLLLSLKTLARNTVLFLAVIQKRMM